jgi:hypothetical protein
MPLKILKDFDKTEEERAILAQNKMVIKALGLKPRKKTPSSRAGEEKVKP